MNLLYLSKQSDTNFIVITEHFCGLAFLSALSSVLSLFRPASVSHFNVIISHVTVNCFYENYTKELSLCQYILYPFAMRYGLIFSSFFLLFVCIYYRVFSCCCFCCSLPWTHSTAVASPCLTGWEMLSWTPFPRDPLDLCPEFVQICFFLKYIIFNPLFFFLHCLKLLNFMVL